MTKVRAQMASKLIAEIRWVKIGAGEQRLEVRYATPCVDANGAFCQLKLVGSWEVVQLETFHDKREYLEQRQMDDLTASGGIVDSP